MKNHVVSLELAKQLKEAGYPQESELYWNYVSNFGDGHTFEVGEIPAKESYAAPLATELLEQLPPFIQMYLDPGVKDDQDNPTWFVKRCLPGDMEKYYNLEVGNTLPDALAEMWLYLKKENLL